MLQCAILIQPPPPQKTTFYMNDYESGTFAWLVEKASCARRGAFMC